MADQRAKSRSVIGRTSRAEKSASSSKNTISGRLSSFKVDQKKVTGRSLESKEGKRALVKGGKVDVEKKLRKLIKQAFTKLQARWRGARVRQRSSSV